MQELNTSVEKNIDSLMSVLRQSVLALCKDIDHQELDYQSASNFTGQIKATVLSFGCRLVEACFESKDNPVKSVELNGTRYLNKGKSPKTVVTSLGKITVRRSYYQHRSGGTCVFPLDERLGIKNEYLMADVK
ncbi:MAG: UPF0236 family protein, partial [Cytophagaceae bacterium]|nr:UPF0236 family protein [Cytophagaceae bacterium]